VSGGSGMVGDGAGAGGGWCGWGMVVRDAVRVRDDYWVKQRQWCLGHSSPAIRSYACRPYAP